MPKDSNPRDILLIGPIGSGKSTIAALLAKRLGWPRCSLDELRWDYYREIGYDEALAARLETEEGFVGKYRYWKTFEAHAVERVLNDYKAGDESRVIDFGGGHSVYENDALFARIERALAPYPNVVLLLPSPDLDASVRLLKVQTGGFVSGELDFDEHFVKHHANHDLAKLTVYTEGKTPEATCAEVMARVTL